MFLRPLPIDGAMASLVRLNPVLLLTLVVGCARSTAGAPLSPGNAVTASRAEAYGCQYDSVIARAAQYRALRTQHPDSVLIPTVGMTACELLAMVGMPSSVRFRQLPEGEALYATYDASLRSEQNVAAFMTSTNGPVVLLMRATRGPGWYIASVSWSH